MNLQFPRKPCPHLPPEVKGLIIDELQALKRPDDTDVLSSIALVWKDASYTIRRYRFKDVQVEALGSRTTPNTLYMILHLIRFAPSIASFIHKLTFENIAYDDIDAFRDIYRHPGFPRLLSLTTNLTAIRICDLSPNELSRQHGQRILDSISSLGRLTELDLLRFSIRRFSDLVLFIHSFRFLRTVRIHNLEVGQFVDLAKAERLQNGKWGYGLGGSGALPLVDYTKYPILHELKFTLQTIRDVEVGCSSSSDAIFFDWLATIFSGVQRLEILAVSGTLCPSIQPILHKFRGSLEELRLFPCRNPDILSLPPLLDTLHFSIGECDDIVDVDIYTRALKRHIEAGHSLKSVVMYIELDECERHEAGAMPTAVVLNRLDGALSSAALGIQKLTWNVNLTIAAGCPMAFDIKRKHSLRCKPIKCWKKWLFYDAFPLTRTRFFAKGSKHLNGTEGQLHWHNSCIMF